MGVSGAIRTTKERLVRLRQVCAIRLVRLQYECQCDCGFLKSVELTVAGRGGTAVSLARGRSWNGRKNTGGALSFKLVKIFQTTKIFHCLFYLYFRFEFRFQY